MRSLLLALLIFAGSGLAEAGERNGALPRADRSGGLTQSAGSLAVSGGTRRDGRERRYDRWRGDGGSRSDVRRGYRDLERSSTRLTRRGSFSYVSHSVNPTDRPYIPALDDVAYGGSGTYTLNSGASSNGGGGYWPDAPVPAFPSEPKIIDIEASRLDRRPIGPSGIEIIHNGGAKIIRIAPGYGETGRREARMERPAAERPRAASRYLQPWTEAWMKHCIAAFDSFDPELGTYTDAAGTLRFCTADE